MSEIEAIDYEVGQDNVRIMVPEWERALETALAQIAPGGSLHIVDFGQMEAWPGFARKGMRCWLARFRVTPCATLLDAARRLAQAYDCGVQEKRIIGGYAWMAVLSRR